MKHFEVIKRTLIYEGRVIRLVRENLLSSSGIRMVRETIQHPGSVVIVPMLDEKQIILVRQYRRAIDREILELPAGTLDVRGESSQECAMRELEEETGWRALKMKRICRFYAAPGLISEQMHLFLAQKLLYVGAKPQPDELIKPVKLSLEQALTKIHKGNICDAKTIIGILLANHLFRKRH